MREDEGVVPPGPEAARILTALEALRKNLLDLTLRNRLLNYRPSKVRGVMVADEDPGQVYRRVVLEGKGMGFRGIPDRTAEKANDISDPPAGNHADDKLNTRYEETPLQDRLLRTWSDAKTILEEQGINTLFLTLGMLEWVEAAPSDRILRAPVLLVPVTLERGERGRYRLKWSGDDVGGNLSLAVKVEEEFRLAWPEVPDPDEFDLGDYLNAVDRAIAGRPGWRLLREAVVVDFFSYAKYLMFKDLDAARWPERGKPYDHPIVSGLLGDGIGADQPPIEDPSSLDDIRPPDSAFEVCDADSSQTLVLVDVASGRNMVVEGPPGTGKSQTIANIIAEAVAHGKTVLFVAEKMAALEVVKRRLDQDRIGDACLELHSHKTRKREFLQELGRTLNLERLSLLGANEHAARLQAARESLNAYVRELHRPLEPGGWTPYEAQGELARIMLNGETPPPGRLSELSGCTREAFEECRRAIRNLQAKVREIGVPGRHPFFGCDPEHFLPGDVPGLTKLLVDARGDVGALIATARSLATQLSADEPVTASEATQMAAAAERIANAPPMVTRLKVSDSRWRTEGERILEALDAGVQRQTLHDHWDATLRDDAWGEDVSALIADLDLGGASWSRVLRPAFYRARSRVKQLCRGAIPSGHEERKALALAIQEEAGCRRTIAAIGPIMGDLANPDWKGLRTEFVPLQAAGAWVVAFHRSVAESEVPATVLRFFDGDRVTTGLKEGARAVYAAASVASAKCRSACDRLRPSPTVFEFAPEDQDLRLELIQLARLATWLAQTTEEPRKVLEIVAYNRVRANCLKLGLKSFCAIADHWVDAGRRMEDALLHTWCDGIVRQAAKERPAFATFEPASHENLVDDFRRLDRAMIEINRDRVRARHRERLPAATGAGATGILREQINLTRRHKSIRWLMQECAGPIQVLKPVLMMSPFSVAMFLPPDGPRFDLVVFDEASQVRPEDAVGAMLRARQAVVVGDSHQLPPTSFFEHTLGDSDDDEGEGVDNHVAAGDMESILSLMRARGAHPRDLQWHYRSRHASLIRVSRSAFYPAMEVFPSPAETSANVGLTLHHLPDTIYGRGGSKTNLEEAKAVARAVQEHARVSPELTLGVAAFSASQQMAILRQLELVQRDDATVEAFAAAHPDEPLFVKNLENVQGDERDVILISVGYGRDAEGRLTLNFGPLNQEGGERRLNVLISRARQRCEVFSNFTADDLPLAANAPMGVRLLKTYLKFAASGDLDVPAVSGREAQSPFEESVSKFLTQHGHTVDGQVGSAGYFIDLAVVDPDHPGRYMLGIECDGAKYHSARSARDRDRLREQVLRLKGWAIHRIWSTAWFHENERESRRLLAAVEAATASGGTIAPPQSPTPSPSIPAVRVQTITTPQGSAGLTVPYATAQVSVSLHGKELHEIWVGTLADLVARVVAVESPVHVEEVIRRIRSAASVQRAGNRIRDAFDRAIRHAAQLKAIVVREDFLWAPGMSIPPVRDRSGLIDGGRSLEFIAPEEIQQLIVDVVKVSFRIRAEELSSEVVRLFGFARLTAEMRARVDGEVSRLTGDGRLELDGDVIRLVATQDDRRA